MKKNGRSNNFRAVKASVVRPDSRTPKEQRSFPEDFLFGASTAAYQIEGAWNVDGKGPSIWDEFTHSHPEKIADQSNADIGANSYEYFMDDIKAVKELGVRIRIRFKFCFKFVINFFLPEY